MKLTIFGATGMVGQQLVKQALWKGHQVRAFGRNIHLIKFEDPNLELVQGVVFDEEDLYNAIHGSNAVLSALGGDFTGEDKARSLGMKKIVAQMQKAAVQRIIAVGGLGVLDNAEGEFILESESYPQEYLPVGNEHLKAYQHLSASALDWTFVCSPDIIDAEPTGKFITTADHPPQVKPLKINAGDLALFMVSELEKNQFIKKRVGISN